MATIIKPDLVNIIAEEKTGWLYWKGIAITKNGAIYQNECTAWKLECNKRKVVKAYAFLDSSSLDQLFQLI